METTNLIIRKFVSSDLNDFCVLIKDKMASKYAIYDDQYPTDDKSLKDILNYFINSDEFYAVELFKEKRLIGFVTLNKVSDTIRNLGYVINSQYQNKGYGTEVVNRIIKYVKEDLKLYKLIAGTAEENLPSMHLLSKCGFTFIGKEKASFLNDEKNNPIYFNGCYFELIL